MAAPTQPDTLFPCTIGDGGLGEPHYEFNSSFPYCLPQCNQLPTCPGLERLQPDHSMVSTKTNEQMLAYWYGNGFEKWC